MNQSTRAFQPSERTKAFLKRISKIELKGIKVAVFDTRMAMKDVDNGFLRFMAKTFGYANDKIEKKLIKKGGMKILPAKDFYVKDMEGPLKDDELEIAQDWIKGIIE